MEEYVAHQTVLVDQLKAGTDPCCYSNIRLEFLTLLGTAHTVRHFIHNV